MQLQGGYETVDPISIQSVGVDQIVKLKLAEGGQEMHDMVACLYSLLRLHLNALSEVAGGNSDDEDENLAAVAACIFS